MKRTNARASFWTAILSALLVLHCGSSKYATNDSYDDAGKYAEAEYAQVTQTESLSRSANRRGEGGAMPAAMPMPMAPSMDYAMAADQEIYMPREQPGGDVLPPVQGEREVPLLIYTGYMTLAIYEVEKIQQDSLALIESMDGWASNRSQYQITFRVPASRFREALEKLGELGDVTDLSWDAQDITDQYTDLQIRLENSRAMRIRLNDLLTKVQTVSDALAIEQQLQRITLEIEQIEGQIRSFDDRMAYSTITLTFSQQVISEVPGEEYRLPFPWLNQLGLEYLLNLY